MTYSSFGLRDPITLKCGWDDTPVCHQIPNFSDNAMILVSARLVNGAGTGSSTAGVVTVSTANTDYVLTLPATLGANAPMQVDAIGEDPLMPGDVLTVTVTTKPGGIAAGSLFDLILIFCGS